jgi:hypothetical protein
MERDRNHLAEWKAIGAGVDEGYKTGGAKWRQAMTGGVSRDPEPKAENV